jgi:hypothetical protein
LANAILEMGPAWPAWPVSAKAAAVADIIDPPSAAVAFSQPPSPWRQGREHDEVALGVGCSHYVEKESVKNQVSPGLQPTPYPNTSELAGSMKVTDTPAAGR